MAVTPSADFPVSVVGDDRCDRLSPGHEQLPQPAYLVFPRVCGIRVWPILVLMAGIPVAYKLRDPEDKTGLPAGPGHFSPSIRAALSLSLC